MFVLLIVCVVIVVPVLYAADRIIKAQARARRMRTMSERLISRPPLSLPDEEPGQDTT